MTAGPRAPSPPPSSRRGRPWNTVELAALDFETTGLDLSKDTIISFGVVPIRSGRIEMGNTVYQLVRPAVPPSPQSVTIHGLRRQDLDGAPSLDEARETLRRALDGRFLVTWWAPVEAGFLGQIFGGTQRMWMKRSIDVRKLVIALQERASPGKPHGSLTLSAVAERYGVPVADSHHALDDALVTAQLFLMMVARLEAHGLRSVDRLLKQTQRDRGLARVLRPRAR